MFVLAMGSVSSPKKTSRSRRVLLFYSFTSSIDLMIFSVALFAFFFFLGQSVGPLFYATAFRLADPTMVIAAVGVAAFCLANVLSRLLGR